MHGSTWSSIGRRFAAAVVVLTALLGLTTEVGAAVYFLKISNPDITGESQIRRHENEIDVHSFSFDFTFRRGCGDLKVIKNIDKASPKLMLSAVLGTIHGSAVLTGATDGETSFDFLKLTLVNAMVTAVNLSDTTGHPPALETVTLAAQQIELVYTPQRADGRPGDPVRAVIPCSGGRGPAGGAAGRP